MSSKIPTNLELYYANVKTAQQNTAALATIERIRNSNSVITRSVNEIPNASKSDIVIDPKRVRQEINKMFAAENLESQNNALKLDPKNPEHIKMLIKAGTYSI